jgi:hypothetical protein
VNNVPTGIVIVPSSEELRRGGGREQRHFFFSGRRLQYSISLLILLTTIVAGVLTVLRFYRIFPLETLIIVGVLAMTLSAVLLYVGQLYVMGWVVDFFDALNHPKPKSLTVPLDLRLVGEVMVVRLGDNISNLDECRAVEKQLREEIKQGHCDFVLDFSSAGRISLHFRSVIVALTKAARHEARTLGKPYHAAVLPPGKTFHQFDDERQALEAIASHGGHGWVVLCGVPVGVRAVSDSLES